MTTGAPIYLVSACTSGEEFVAAFRRYADRNGLFVPMADPIAAGRRGRFAVTLSDGGVMVEGEAEVVSSTKSPSVLHGRVGMTIRFLDPDDRSKTVLVELEKARLSLRPPPPSVPPRPADIPPQPRAVPPRPMGRIDATNALAECVAIGAIDALEAVDKASASGSMPKLGPRFVVPTIPPVTGAQRPKSPSTPVVGLAPEPRPRTPSAAPEIASGPAPPASQAPPTAAASHPSSAAPPPGRAAGRAAAIAAEAPEPTHPPIAMSRTATIAAAAPPPADPPPAILPAMSRTATLAATVAPPPAVPARPTEDGLPIAARPTLRDTDAEQLIPARAPITTQVEPPPASCDAMTPLDLDSDLESPTLTRPFVEPTETHREALTYVTPPRPVPVVVAAPEPIPNGTGGSIHPPGHAARRSTTSSPPMPANPTPAGAVPVARSAATTMTPPHAVPQPGAARTTPSGAVPAVARTPASTPPFARPPTPAQPLPVAAAVPSPAPAAAAVPAAPIIAARSGPMASSLIVDELAEPTDLTAIPGELLDELFDEPIASRPFSDQVEAAEPPPRAVHDLAQPAVTEPRRKTRIGIAVIPAATAPAAATVSSGAPTNEPRDTSVMSSWMPPDGSVGPNGIDAEAEEPPARTKIEGAPEAPPTTIAQAKIERAPEVPPATTAQAPIDAPRASLPQVEEPTPSGDWTMTPGADGPTIEPRNLPKPKPTPSSLPTGDWTIELDAKSPDGWSPPVKVTPVGEDRIRSAAPRATPPAPVEPQPRAATPAPVEPPKKRPTTPPAGPPVATVASTTPLDTEPRRDSQPRIVRVEPKVQVDPTLIEPLQAMPAHDERAAGDHSPGALDAASSSHPAATSSARLRVASVAPRVTYPGPIVYAPPIAGHPPRPTPGHAQDQHRSGRASPAAPPYPSTRGASPPRLVTDGGTGFFRDSSQEIRYPTGPHDAVDDRRHHLKVIAISAAAAVLVGAVFVIVFTMGGDDGPPEITPTDRSARRPALDTPGPDAAGVERGPDAAAAVAPIDARAGAATSAGLDAGAELPAQPVVDAQPASACFAEVATTPPGAEILQDRTTSLGTTPAKLTLPCGAEIKLTFRKPRYLSVDKRVTPTEQGARVKLILARVTFSVKVSSTPPGATIVAAGKTLGVTPTTVKLTAFEASTLTIIKDGFATEQQRITPKSNNQAIHANLKKLGR